MSNTPKTDAWKLEVCGQGGSAYLAWPNSVWDGIEQMETALTMRTALLEQQVAVSNALEKQLVKALDQIKKMDADMLVMARTLAETEVTKASMAFLDEALNSGDGSYRP